MHVFGNLGKFQTVTTFTKYIKFTARHNFIKIFTTAVMEIVIFPIFFSLSLYYDTVI